MDNEKRLQLVNYFFWALIIIILMLALTGIFGAVTLIQSQKWVDHSNKVLNEIKTAKQNFSLADYAGRNRIFTPIAVDEIQSQRDKAISSVSNLKTVMADNYQQIDNIGLLEKAVKNRFSIQDEQFNSIIRDGDRISYDLDIVSKSLTYTETIDTLFYQLELNEMNLVRVERMPRLAQWQWLILYAFFGVVGLLLIVTIILSVLHKNLLNRLLLLGDRMDEFIHSTESTDQANQDVVKFAEYIKGETNDLPNFVISE